MTVTESFDLFEALDRSEVGRAILDRIEEDARRRDGVAREALWQAEDGWVIAYTTSRVQGGPHDGKFLARALRPGGKGARSGNPEYVKETYRREFASRKSAKKRAVQMFAQHSPRWAEKHGEWVKSL